MLDRDLIEHRAHERLVTGQAWEDFCDTLKVAGRMVERFDGLSDLDRAEWYRFLTRLLRSGLERLVENGEPTRPRLRDTPWRQSINVQTVDQDHLMCQFDEAREYRITGTRGTIPYFVIATLASPETADVAARDWSSSGIEGLKIFDPSNLKTCGFLGSQQLEVAPDGTFEVVLSQKDPGNGKAWVRMTPDTNCVLIRLVWSDREREVAPAMHIERIDGAAPEPITPALTAGNLARAAQNVLGYAELVRNWWQGSQGNFVSKLNRLDYSRAQYLSNGGVPDRHVAFGGWQKRHDEALVLEFMPPDCEYWNFQLCNIWQENLDTFEDGNGWVSNYRVALEADGRVRIIVAEHDPAIGGNWINSFGHDKGIWGLRLVRTESTVPVKLWRVPLAALKADGEQLLAGSAATQTGRFVD